MSNPTKVTRRAAICLPESVTQRDIAAGVAHHFGGRPTWVVTVSAPTYDRLRAMLSGMCDGPAVAAIRFGACKPDPSAGIGLVLALQMHCTQVRCVAALDDTCVQAFLRHAARSDSVQMALGRHHGEQYAVFDVPVPRDNLQRVVALSTQSTSLAAQAIAVQLTAQLCHRRDELPSLLAGYQVDSVDVAAVPAGVDLFGLDGAALARIEHQLGQHQGG